ncbi:MAG: RNA 2',3'-cyclic phosphodiesterase [Steroidobacteraceae bacterium]
MKGPSTQRLFFALWPDDARRQALLDAIRSLRLDPTGRAVPDGNLHVTLAFLGNVPADKLPTLRTLGAAMVWPRGDLVFDRLAWWPKARLLCLEASLLPPSFAAAVAAFHEELRRAGFKVEQRPFRAHVTVARNAAAPAHDSPGRPIPPFNWPLQGVALVASTPTPEGSVYQVVERY